MMIQRVPSGSMERFTGISIEHFGGEFPAWLAPTQAVAILIRDIHNEYALKVRAKLKTTGLRIKADVQDRNMRSKIKQHHKINIKNRTVLIRLRTDEDLSTMSLDDFVAFAKETVNTNALEIRPQIK